ncbi:branched-chain amino acid ABC transporter substrate-binding protein [Sinorhizobium numidicum]|uniref:Branched-chain amino acid ABC transporter substrate-binding protein n=1 Tax=Sinorhizobium numidicum TaxID=680248 RepID=A0ABY8CV82_9HYPH|nr:branched-chain amino acid ABC transporter substrate-binding protein [Sinorhizobium numidicum]WEX75892.1 branched-chain amino acid ABC transporter substrate-binding protein [Sinorhizobium numidicum]WEX82551.1 branched-chain amino acid ABC transporter substrate-binding protein [Sinorhizobium numidicum]
MLKSIVTSLFVAGLALAAPAFAAGLKVAVVAPAEGPFATLGKQVTDGAAFQAGDRGSQTIFINESCDPAGGEALTKALLASGAEAAIGFLCTESLEAALPALAQAGIPAITLSVRSDILMEDALKKKWPLYRLAPSGKAEAAAITELIIANWRGKPLALIDDGTIHSRELVEGVRSALAEIGITPVFTDTYRPAQEQQVSLVRRLAKSGATHVFTGGDRYDTAIIARDAKAENVQITLLGGDTLNAADLDVPLQDGVLAVTVPDAARSNEAAPVVKAMRAAGIEPEGYVLPAFAAMSLLERAKDQAAKDGNALADALLKGPYATVLGPIKFNGSHERAETPYRLMQWQGGRFVDVPDAGSAE